jgi:hypothetical protein
MKILRYFPFPNRAMDHCFCKLVSPDSVVLPSRDWFRRNISGPFHVTPLEDVCRSVCRLARLDAPAHQVRNNCLPPSTEVSTLGKQALAATVATGRTGSALSLRVSARRPLPHSVSSTTAFATSPSHHPLRCISGFCITWEPISAFDFHQSIKTVSPQAGLKLRSDQLPRWSGVVPQPRLQLQLHNPRMAANVPFGPDTPISIKVVFEKNTARKFKVPFSELGPDVLPAKVRLNQPSTLFDDDLRHHHLIES